MEMDVPPRVLLRQDTSAPEDLLYLLTLVYMFVATALSKPLKNVMMQTMSMEMDVVTA